SRKIGKLFRNAALRSNATFVKFHSPIRSFVPQMEEQTLSNVALPADVLPDKSMINGSISKCFNKGEANVPSMKNTAVFSLEIGWNTTFAYLFKSDLDLKASIND